MNVSCENWVGATLAFGIASTEGYRKHEPSSLIDLLYHTMASAEH